MRKIIIFLLALIQIPFVNAYVQCSPATSDTTVTDLTSTSYPEIVINEVSPKNTTADFIELFIKNDLNEGNGTNLKNIIIEDSDGNVKTIQTDLIAKSGNYIILTMNSSTTDETSDTNNKIQLYSSKTGLVSTNAYVIIKKDSKIIDFVCWTDGQSTTFQTKLNNLITSAEWNPGCFQSGNIKDNQSLGRNTNSDNTKTIADFNLFIHPTPGIQNILQNNPPVANIQIQSGAITGKTPLSINVTGAGSTDPDNDTLTYSWDFGDGHQLIAENPDSHSYTNPGNYILSLTVSDPLGASNTAQLNISAQSASDTEPPETTPAQTTKTLIINEFLPDPEGTDTNKEWIEIKNIGTMSINLKDFKLDDMEGGSSPYALPDYNLQPSEIKVFYNDITKISLNNDTDRVRILNSTETIIDEIYYEKPISAISYMRSSDAKWVMTSKQTPGTENELISVENSTTTCNEVTSTGNISSSASNKTIQIEKQDYSDADLIITEVFPNPKSVDSNKEWIEIMNESDKTINLKDWIISSSKKKFTVKKDLQIKSGEYLALASSETKILAKNTGDKISILDPDKNIVDEISFTSSKEDLSYSLIKTGDELKWEWTKELTKGKKNPEFEILSGTIKSADNDNKILEFSAGDKTIKASYKDLDIPSSLLASVFKADSILSIKAQNKGNEEYEISSFEQKPEIPEMESKTTEPPAPNQKPDYFTLLIFTIGLIALTATYKIFIHYKKNRSS